MPDADYVASFNRSAMRPSTLKFPERKATICEKSLRTVNTNAECGAPDDFWYHHPWRYPGISPVTDACGTAGGILPGQGQGSAGASYTDTEKVKHGDLGSKLPPLDSGTTYVQQLPLRLLPEASKKLLLATAGRPVLVWRSHGT